MNELYNTWQTLISSLDRVKENGQNHITACCPAHDDSNPSLSISMTEDRILFNCHAGCSFQDIIRALNMGNYSFGLSNKTNSELQKIIARYKYKNIEGKNVYDVVRFEPKDFRTQRPDGKWTLDGVTRVPYRLPQLLAGIKEGKEILLLEGEKDCDNAENIGLVATTFPGGAGKWRKEYSKWFQEAKVICLPDNDSA